MNKVLVITLGKTKTTKLLLGTSWVAGRIAFESSGEVFGQDFHNSALATNPITLAAVIPVKSRVIDIGCGTGRWSRVVADLGCQVLGVDYSTQNIQTARALGGNIEYLEFDVTKKIEMLGQFDFALLIHVLEHVEYPEQLLCELRINCKKLVIEVPDHESNPLNWVRIKMNQPYYTDADHVREYSIGLIRKQLKATGWKDTYLIQKGGAIFLLAE